MSARRHALLLAFLLVVQLTILSLQVRSGRAGAPPGDVLFQVFGPAAKVGSGGIRALGALWNGYVDLRGARRRSMELQDEVRDLHMRLAALGEVRRENDRLRALLDMRTERSWATAVGAHVVAVHRGPGAGTIILDRGTRHGVKRDLAVVTEEGVVGRVVTSGPGTSKVQLLTDPLAATAIVFSRSRDHATGIAAGGVGQILEVRYVSNLADVQPGDQAITSGLDGIYPPGLAVGTVASVRDQADLTKDIRLLPAVHFGRLEEVLVLERAPDPPPDQGVEEGKIARR